MADSKATALTALTAITGDDLLYAVDDVAGTPVSRKVAATVLRDFTNMAQTTASPTTADVAGVVNTLHLLDISGLTASRNFVLPATAAVNDRVGVSITTGDDTYALILKADTGDSIIASTSTFTATEWTRLLMAGETVFFRCIVANTTWIVEYDGRIPCKGLMYLSTDADAEGVATLTLPTSAATPGAWTVDSNVGLIDGSATSRWDFRRSGKYNVYICGRSKDALADGKYFQLQLFLNNTTGLLAPSTPAAGALVTRAEAIAYGYTFSAGDYVQFKYATEQGGLGIRGTGLITQFAIQEVL